MKNNELVKYAFTEKFILQKYDTLLHTDLSVRNNVIEVNKAVIDEFPFLRPTTYGEYDYSYTLLDDIEYGWRYTIAYNLCVELKEILIKHNSLNYFEISEIREKFGTLRISFSGISDFDTFNDVSEVLDKYSDLSMLYCINCGKLTNYVSKGYINYVCKSCAKNDDVPMSSYRKLSSRDVPKRGIYVDGKLKFIDSQVKDKLVAQWKVKRNKK